jgi:hypothetical protein
MVDLARAMQGSRFQCSRRQPAVRDAGDLPA